MTIYDRSVRGLACGLFDRGFGHEAAAARLGIPLKAVRQWHLMCLVKSVFLKGTAVGILDQIHPMRLAPNPFGTAWGSCNPGRS